MEKFEFIDTHAHLLKGYDYKYLDECAENDSLKQVWLLGIPPYSDHCCENDDILKVAKRYPKFFIPFGTIDWNGKAEQIDKMRDDGFCALKAICPTKNYDDLSFFPIYERAEKLGMPILFHVGIIGKGGMAKRLDMGYAAGPTRMRPSMLDTISAAFPKLKLIQGHMGTPWCNELFESLYYYPNIHCSVSGFIDYKWLIENLDRGNINFGFSFTEKFMFATDGGYGHKENLSEVIEFATFMRNFFQHVGRSYNWGQHHEDFLISNAKRYFENNITVI